MIIRSCNIHAEYLSSPQGGTASLGEQKTAKLEMMK